MNSIKRQDGDGGRCPPGPGHSAQPEPVPVSAVPASVPNASYDDYDDDWDSEVCWQCGGEGFVYDCFEEYACIDPEGGCHLCMSRCDVCRPRKPSPELQQVLADALAQGIEARSDETPQEVRPGGQEPGAGTACAQPQDPTS